MSHVPFPPFDNHTATQNVRLAEDAWSHDPVQALSLNRQFRCDDRHEARRPSYC
jgi:nuclear transport factor 2 (NTF2) superfamily protein